jgi:hypothetical protein
VDRDVPEADDPSPVDLGVPIAEVPRKVSRSLSMIRSFWRTALRRRSLSRKAVSDTPTRKLWIASAASTISRR